MKKQQGKAKTQSDVKQPDVDKSKELSDNLERSMTPASLQPDGLALEESVEGNGQASQVEVTGAAEKSPEQDLAGDIDKMFESAEASDAEVHNAGFQPITIPSDFEGAPNHIKDFMAFMDAFYLRIPDDNEAIQHINSVRSSIYQIFNNANREEANHQLRLIITAIREQKGKSFTPVNVLRNLNKLRWATGQVTEYETIITAMSRIAAGTASKLNWEQVRKDIRPINSDEYSSRLMAVAGLL